MRATEEVLTLVRASGVQLDSCRTSTWRQQALAVLAQSPPGNYAVLCDAMFDATPHDHRALCAAPDSDDGMCFRVAPQGSQLELVQRAIAGLQDKGDTALSNDAMRLFIYATNSVDENIFRSTVACAAVELGLSTLPHFGLTQLHGASLGVALDVMGGALPNPGEAALFVAVERWPLPYPRTWGAHPWADSAAALLLARGAARGLQHLGSVQRGFAPFLVSAPLAPEHGRLSSPPHIEREALEAAALEVIGALLDRHNLSAGDLDGWIGCALDLKLDERLRARLAPRVHHVIRPKPDDGDAMAASTPLLLAQLLEQMNLGQLRHGGLWLAWNAGLSGTISASLWRVSLEGGLQ